MRKRNRGKNISNNVINQVRNDFRYVNEVKQQMKEREMDRLLEAERIEEESRMLNKALIALQKEEEEKLKEKKDRQLKMREAFKKANAEAEQYRNLRNEEQRISDLRVGRFNYQHFYHCSNINLFFRYKNL